VKDLFLRFIKWTANRIHNLRGQLFMASLYGMVACYGFKGTFAIVMKLRTEELNRIKREQSRRQQHGRTEETRSIPKTNG
jgi:hypothetical protein